MGVGTGYSAGSSAGDLKLLEKVTTRNLTTGITQGGILSINGDTTKYDIADGDGIIIDQFSDTENPTYSKIVWTGLTAQVVASPLLLTTFVAIDKGTLISEGVYQGVVVTQSTVLTQEQKRDLILIGLVVTLDGVNVNLVSNNPHSTLGDSYLSEDVSNALGIINTSGNHFTPNGANLALDKEGGSEFANGINYAINIKDPNNRTSVLQTGITFIYNYSDGAGGSTVVTGQTLIDPDQYDDDDGTLGSVGNNRFTNQRLFWFSNLDIVVIQYGQQTYSTMADAVADSLTGTWTNNSDLGLSACRTVLSVAKGATDLTDPLQAIFKHTNKFGFG